MSIAAASHHFASSSVPSVRYVPSVRPARAHLRLTRRGRGVLLTIVAAPLVAIALFAGLNAGGATATSSSTPLSTVTVASGQSLWQLARHIAPNADPRDVISDIIDVNQLASADVYPGERLEIPAQYSH
jgi:LysM repeat protein